ncbi:MAG TPA: CRTAC1 family protein [candidate division Zixibacteria bacterium]|nr:CRTAC1 family protein [candidate division Zixibacteria bacterium]
MSVGGVHRQTLPRGRLWLGVLGLAGVLAVGGAGFFKAGGLPALAGDPGVPHFVDEAEAAGIEHAYTGGFTHVVGGGVAAFDCDDDGLLDLYLAGGDAPAALYRNISPIGGSLRFTRVPSATTDVAHVTGAYPLDFDSDGVLDLAVLRLGENLLLRGLGGCRFERANEALGFDGGDDWSTAFSATWEADNALPTLAIGNYLDLAAYRRNEYRCVDGQLFRPDGSGRYRPPASLSPSYCSLSMLFSDWDRSGRRDLRVSNDRQYYRENGSEQLWRIEPDRRPRLYTEADGWRPLRIWGMGIASRDLTDDGYPEVYLTSQGDNKLQTLVSPGAGPTYRDIALERGVTAHRPYAGDTTLPSTGWHAEFADVNNDGLADLFVSKGNVEAQLDFAARDPSNLLLGRSDGTFVEAAPDAGIVSFARARGAALVDLNLDGLLDLVVVNRQENILLWRNVGSGTADDPEHMGRWIALRLRQPGPNRDAIGAWLEVRAGDRTQRHELTVGGGHISGSLGWIHIGLGSADEAEVTITWPDGSREGPIRVAAATRGVIERGSGSVEPWVP